MPVSLITGANRGIGFELARQYAAEGWAVIATCRRPEDAADLRGIAGKVRIEPLDVNLPDQVQALKQSLGGQPIDLLVNNAGIYGPRLAPYDQIDYGVWEEVLRVNTLAPLRVSAAFAGNVARSRRRLIVAMSSSMGSIADNRAGGSYMYRSSKAALNAAMRSLAIDLRTLGISVTVLDPGWVRTDMGGPQARVDVKGLRGVIAELGPESSGRFFNYEGRELPW
jgi:NAD(P)-dependent dehydrogenase (short-subunit alcohol dehydrogenase family)